MCEDRMSLDVLHALCASITCCCRLDSYGVTGYDAAMLGPKDRICTCSLQGLYMTHTRPFMSTCVSCCPIKCNKHSCFPTETSATKIRCGFERTDKFAGMQHGMAASMTCMVLMSKRPRKSLTDTKRSNTVRYMSADVPAQAPEATWHRFACGYMCKVMQLQGQCGATFVRKLVRSHQ